MPTKNRPVSNGEMIGAIKLTIDHNTTRANQQIALATDTKSKELARAGFDEVIDGHFSLLKMFVFIDMIESNNLSVPHLEDLINEHIKIIDEQLEKKVLNDTERSKIEYNKRLWETMREKMNAYMTLLSPVE